jgi:hypothetical protein
MGMLLQLDNFEDAVRDYAKATEIMPGDKSYEASYKSAKRAEKMSTGKDLYTLLVRPPRAAAAPAPAARPPTHTFARAVSRNPPTL